MTKKIEKKKIDWRIVAIGIAGLVAIEIVALMKGINGALLTTIVAVICVAIGVTIPNPIKVK